MQAKQTWRPATRRCAGVGVVTLALLGAAMPVAADRSGPDLGRFYRQRVAWSACEPDMPKDMQCGKVTVPVDYTRPATATLDLAVSRFRATGPSRGSVLLNFGGPGGAGVPALAADSKQFMDLTNGYDVVGFDPRGVGRSSPVTCGSDGEDTSSDAGGGATGNPDPNDARAAMAVWQRMAVQCARHSGPVLPHIGTADSARDMDVIRQALGDRKLNYLGFSYGTRLGAVYAAEFPDRVGRMVLDGVDTLTEPLSEQGRVAAEGQQTALDDFLDWCVQDIACPFGQDRRQAGTQVQKLVASLDENPVPSPSGGSMSGQDLVGAISQALYSKQMWPSLERAIASLVQDGDTRGIEAFSAGGVTLPGAPRRDPHSGRNGGGGLVPTADIPLDNLPAAMMAINCADDPDRPPADVIARDLGRLRAAYQEASPVFGRYQLSEVLMCYGRPKGSSYIRDRVKNLDAAKMLLVGTRGDPATPYRWTVETARRIGSPAVVLDNRGDGHTGYSSSTCVHRKVNDFLLDGSLPPSGSSCGADPSMQLD
ncbi:alpha/beta hydrolase [Streptomyces tropicalis]|uniref:Alpha/beta hydrolase n=1 Tax=Streptomyces tropicalis TaxID=3034234 RepID=A0ABT6A9J6_9ACTN|nr:alpha/beta hydrolase [Streptomyces tropicalis]MDF3301334.1 alpha/beta hydrolase [Streptomyces tropicalis]